MPLLWYAIAAIWPGPAGAGVLAGVAVAVAALLAVALAARIAGRSAATTAATSVATQSTRARARRDRPVRLLDPDAAGRPRPRAPAHLS